MIKINNAKLADNSVVDLEINNGVISKLSKSSGKQTDGIDGQVHVRAWPYAVIPVTAFRECSLRRRSAQQRDRSKVLQLIWAKSWVSQRALRQISDNAFFFVRQLSNQCLTERMASHCEQVSADVA